MTVVVTGGLAFDYLMTFPGKFSDHLEPGQLERFSLSLPADSLRREYGGAAGNLAYNP
jgi:adenosine kinase